MDSYEEGTWSPTVTFGGASTGVTYGTQEGWYTKVGRLVHATLHITLTSKGSSTGGFFIEGLPFNVGARSAGSISYYDTIDSGVDEPMLFLAISPAKMAVYHCSDSNTPNVQNTSLNNSSRFYVTVVYST